MNLVIEPTGEIGNVISSRESVLMWPSCWPLAHAFMRRGERAHTKGPVGRCNNNSRRSEGLHSGSGLERGHAAFTSNTFNEICSTFRDGPESGRVMRFASHRPCNASMNFTHGQGQSRAQGLLSRLLMVGIILARRRKRA